MPTLRELELAFVRSMFDATDIAAESFVCANGMAPAARLAIYRNNIVQNYREALRDVYPVVERLVGEAFFRFAADSYIPCHPSCQGNLHGFGGEFAAFLEQFPPAAGLPYLGDVSRLEWNWHESFHAADASAMAIDRLMTVAEAALPSLHFQLHPSCRLLASPFPVDRIWAANQPDAAESVTVDLAAGAVRLLIRRRGDAVAIELVGDPEFALLAALMQGLPLQGALHAAQAFDTSFDLAAFLVRRVTNSTLVGFVAPTGATIGSATPPDARAPSPTIALTET
ncbi:MAG: hypothetical protein AW12_02872 [Candidatus Accumulibacter sp. BA-94]|nr:MAG: hypothetical protein AW12_02872 [Candidatus Accumulibacter sp. BA-94]HRD91831.1 DNA-binding domain-containing protein [Accumulibacter sp.]